MLRGIRADLLTDREAPRNRLSSLTTEGEKPRGPSGNNRADLSLDS